MWVRGVFGLKPSAEMRSVELRSYRQAVVSNSSSLFQEFCVIKCTRLPSGLSTEKGFQGVGIEVPSNLSICTLPIRSTF